MIQHLTFADYTAQPWANGRGRTVEMMRVNHPDGRLLWRLSMASVIEDGPFSTFPGVERNLTVIGGSGFDLWGDIRLRAAFLRPVAFSGDVPVAAAGVTDICVDFNVMTCRSLPLPQVRVIANEAASPPPGGALCLFALAPAQAGVHALLRHDLLIGREAVQITGGPAIAVGLTV